jgi:hypothetical protein
VVRLPTDKITASAQRHGKVKAWDEEPASQTTRAADGESAARVVNRVSFGQLTASFDGSIVSLSVPEQTSLHLLPHQAGDLVEAFDRHDGLLLGTFDYREQPDGTVELPWDDYDADEQPVGGTLTIPAVHVSALRDWLAAIPLPPMDARGDEFRERKRRVRVDLYAGLPDAVNHE